MDFWLNSILLYLGPKRPIASGLPRGKHGWPSNSQWFLVFCLSDELGTNLSCYQGTFFGTLWTWRTVLRLSTQLRHSTRKNETHIVAASLPPPIYHAVLAFRRHKWGQVSGQEGQLSFLLAIFLGAEAGAGQVFVLMFWSILKNLVASWEENASPATQEALQGLKSAHPVA